MRRAGRRTPRAIGWLLAGFAACVAQAQQYAGTPACATCHKEIADAYRTTPMAQSSGALSEPLPGGEFVHSSSDSRYRIEGNTVEVSPRRSPAAPARMPLQWFIGSGAAGRSYLFSQEGFLFLAPVTWYAEARRWDMSPGYQDSERSLWNRPIEPNCLFCHSSRPRPIYGTQNRYADPPFVEGGIGCERCHGPGAAHAAKPAKENIVHPARLAPARRDSLCAQCHLTGAARIDRAGTQLALFRPGDDLRDYVSVFVNAAAAQQGLRVTSHVEKLSHSRCQQSAGEAMWCGTCHDAHRVPDAAAKASWYRTRCLGCHESKLDTAHASRADCTSCHMPRIQASDANHGVFTDHSIPRRGPRPVRGARQQGDTLLPFAGFAGDDRTLGLAYAEAALESNQPAHRRKALALLRAALPKAGDDPSVLTRLAFLEQNEAGRPDVALALYERSLRLRPAQPVALVNAGTLYAQGGAVDRAIECWRKALAMNPGLTEASQNLAIALRAAGRTAEARQVLRDAARFVPGVDR